MPALSFNLIAKDLSFKREEKIIFSKISFNLKSGQALWIKGSNGSGKTTFLRVLAGILTKFSGNLKLYKSASNQSKETQLKGSTTYIGHQIACWQHKSVIDNLEFWAKITKNQELMFVAINLFELGWACDLPLYKLSGGWQKKVDLARLIIFNCKIWLLDEPFVNLDQKTKQFLRNLIKTRLENGGILIISSHEEILLEGAKTLNL